MAEVRQKKKKFFFVQHKSGILILNFVLKIYEGFIKNIVIFLFRWELTFFLHFYRVLNCFIHRNLSWKKILSFAVPNDVHWKNWFYRTYHRSAQLAQPILLCTHYFPVQTFFDSSFDWFYTEIYYKSHNFLAFTKTTLLDQYFKMDDDAWRCVKNEYFAVYVVM